MIDNPICSKEKLINRFIWYDKKFPSKKAKSCNLNYMLLFNTIVTIFLQFYMFS